MPFGCIGPRDSCERHSDCASGICSANGYCQTECKANRDCPCGAHCEASCGVCIRDDGAGAATCFAFHHGVGRDEVLGACGLGAPETSPTEAGTDDRVCAPHVLTLPECVEDPPAPADAGAARDSGPSADSGQSPSTDSGPRKPDASGTDATPPKADAGPSADAAPSNRDGGGS